jgi:hypothetical protein
LALTLEGASYCQYDVQLGPTAEHDHPGVIQGCTKLTRLELCDCSIVDVMDAPAGTVLDCLSSLVNLEHFVMRDCNPVTLSSATLPSMLHLTHLDMHGLSVENMLQLTLLTNLEELHFAAVGDLVVGLSSVPGLTFPPSLTELVLESPIEAGLLSIVPPGLQHLEIECVVQGPAEAPGVFLSGMARLQHLTCLHIDGCDPEWPPVGRAYSALTTSSKLVELSLCDAELPKNTWFNAFWPSRRLPHLTSLNIFNDVHGDELGVGLPWDVADMFHLVLCCPNLRTISAISLQHGVLVSELVQLTALTRMHVIYGPVDGWPRVGDTMSGLAILTQLEELTGCLYGCDVRTSELLPLTRLTCLTELRLVTRPGNGQGNDDNDDGGEGNGGHLWGTVISLTKYTVRHLVCNKAHALVQSCKCAHLEQQALFQQNCSCAPFGAQIAGHVFTTAILFSIGQVHMVAFDSLLVPAMQACCDPASHL